jgi:putative flippase GtrA
MKYDFPIDNTQKVSSILERDLFRSATSFIEEIFYRYAWIKFGIVGGLGSLVHLAVLFSLTDLVQLWYIFSAGVAVLISATCNYILNHAWTFKEKKVKNHTIGWSKYIVLAMIFDGAYFLLLSYFTEILGLWYMISSFVAMMIVFPFRYNFSKTWVWGNFNLSNFISTKHPDDADYDWHAYSNGSLVQKWWKISIAKAVWSFSLDGSNVLDIGCGSSPIASKYNGISIDYNQAKIEFMKRNQHDGNNRKYLMGDARQLPFQNSSFDSVLCIELIEHMDDPVKVIAEISRVAKPNAKIVLATPDYSRPLAHIVDVMTPYGNDHCYRFTKKHLNKLCRAHGLEPVKHKYIGGCDLVALFQKIDNNTKAS